MACINSWTRAVKAKNGLHKLLDPGRQSKKWDESTDISDTDTAFGALRGHQVLSRFSGRILDSTPWIRSELPPASHGGRRLSAGAKVGIGVRASGAALTLLGVAACLFMHKKEG